ncbi:MAG TPA: hypothetical protein VF637_15300 [Sphingomicrobium sp.]
MAANNANQQFITGLNQPNIDRGAAASDLYAGLLNVGGDPAKSAAALDTYRTSTGYQDLLKTGFGAVNANAYAHGFGDSGATLKELQRKGMALADQNQQNYLGNLNNLIQTGNSAIGNVSGVATHTTDANASANQTLADARGNAALNNGAIWSNLIKTTDKKFDNLASSYMGGFGG